MGRWQPGAAERLRTAALAAFAESGYEQATVAGIAERAGLSERTFFRHFADKREVLFAAQDAFVATVLEALATAPPDVPPLGAVLTGLAATSAWFTDEQRPASRARQDVIDAHPDLQERELIKMDRLGAAITAALRERATEEPAATLAAAVGVAAYRLAFTAWVRDSHDRDLAWHLHAAVRQLQAVTAAHHP